MVHPATATERRPAGMQAGEHAMIVALYADRSSARVERVASVGWIPSKIDRHIARATGQVDRRLDDVASAGGGGKPARQWMPQNTLLDLPLQPQTTVNADRDGSDQRGTVVMQQHKQLHRSTDNADTGLDESDRRVQDRKHIRVLQSRYGLRRECIYLIVIELQ